MDTPRGVLEVVVADDDSERLAAVGDEVARLLAEFASAKRVRDQGYRLGLADLRLISLFSDDRPRTLREIAEETRLEQSTVNRQVNAALASGLLERYSVKGSRSQLIALSEEGRQWYHRDSVWGREAFTRAMAALGEVDAAEFCMLLERFTIAYGHAVDGTPQHLELQDRA